MDHRRLGVVLAGILVTSAIPVGAVAPVFATGSHQGTEGNATVNVTTGPQLSTVLAVTSEDVESEIGATGFRARVETADESERADAIADRADELSERAEAIREDYEDATETFREGEIDRSEYARRLATLNARAENLVAAYRDLQERAANVSTAELAAAGLNRTALAERIERVDSVRGTGPRALLERFTGEREGEVELEMNGGLAIEVESEDGERSREIERPGDASTEVTVTQSDALGTARDALANATGSWVLTETSVDRDDGVYEFAFRLDANRSTGEAEVTVDGSSGRVLSLEEEVEPTEDREDDREREGDEEREDERETETEGAETEEVAVTLAEGEPAPDARVTVRVLADGEPASNVTVRLNDRPVGTTDANGTLRVHLPASGEVELVAETDGEDGELAFDLGENESAGDVRTDVTLSDGTVTVSVSADGDGVADATVFADGDRVGTTGDDGTVSFAIDDGQEELEVSVVKGEFEREFEYVVRNDTLVPEERAESDEAETETEHEEETETEDDEEETPEPTETDGEDDS